jgi:outer membrane protein TolC
MAVDPELDVVEFQIEEAQAEQMGAERLWRPRVSTYLRSGIGSNGLAETQLGNQIGLEGRQRIFDFGDSRRRKRLAQAEVSVAEATRSLAAAQIAEDTVDLYYEIVRSDALIALSSSSQAILSDRLSTSEALLRDSLSTQSDVYALRMELQTEQSRETLNRLQKRQAQETLRILSGQNASVCPTDAGPRFQTLDETSLLALAEAQPSVIAATSRVEAAKQALNVEQKTRLPVIELVGRSGYAGTDFDQWNYEDRLSLSVSVPIYAGGQLDAATRGSRARRSQAQASMMQARREALVELSLTQQKILSLTDRLQILRQAVGNSILERDAIRTRIDMNAGTLSTFFEAHRRYVALERDRIDTQHELSVSQAKLAIRSPGGPLSTGF